MTKLHKESRDITAGDRAADDLIFSRSVGTLKACALKPGQTHDVATYRARVREQRFADRVRRCHDVFDLDEIVVDAVPIARRQMFRDTS